MKTNTKKSYSTVWQRLDHFCASQVLLLGIVGLMTFGITYETHLREAFREIYYNQGMGFLNIYLHGEEARSPTMYDTGIRGITTSGR